MTTVNKSVLLDHLTSGDNEGFGACSPYAAALLPLVSVLDVKTTLRDVAESLPDGEFEFDSACFRAILDRLGYNCDLINTSIKDIPEHRLPCVFESNGGGVYVIYKREKDQYIYLDCNTGATAFDSLSENGFFYQVSHSSLDALFEGKDQSWAWTVLGRFRPIYTYLTLLTLIINLMVLCVPFFIMTVYDSVIGNSSLESLWALLAGIVMALTTELGLRLIRARILALPAGRLNYILATHALRQLLSLPTILTERASFAVQMAKFKQYECVRDFFTGPAALLTFELPFVPLFIVALALLGGNLALIPVAVMVVFILFGVYIIPYMKQVIQVSADRRTRQEQMIMELLSSVYEIKTLANEEGWLRRVERSAEAVSDSHYRASNAYSLIQNFTQTTLLLASVTMVWLGGLKAMEGQMSIGALIASMAILWRIVTPLQMFLLTYFNFSQALKGVKGINELMSLTPEKFTNASSMMKKDQKGEIRLERVSFRYSPTLDPCLIGVNFHIPEKQFVTIVGGNGSGKSTILKLLCGMYIPQIGNILIDDTDIRQFNTHELRHEISFVPQYPRLFTGDIAFNLKLRDILAKDEALSNALENAGILKQIQDLPNGLNTLVNGNNSNALPIGFQQSLCIARALVGEASIILLDEPSAELDKQGMDNLLKLLSSMKGKRTIVIATHAKELIQLSDNVIEVERGIVQKISTPSTYLGNELPVGVSIK